MARLTQIELPNGTTYDIEDGNKSGIYTVIGTQTAATGTWTGALHGVSALYDGLTIMYYLPWAGSGNATLNLTLDGGTTTGAKNCYYGGTTRLTTHYGKGSNIVLTYWSAGSIKIDGTATTDDRWIANANYDSNNKVSQTATTTSADYEILFSQTADNTTRTEAARKNDNLKFNPSTGNLQTTQLNGVTIGSSPKFTDTTYTAGTGLSLSSNSFSVKTGYTTSGNNRAVTADSSGNLYVTQKDTDTTYTLGTNGNNVTLTPAGGTAQSITVPYATSAGSATDSTKVAKAGDTMTGILKMKGAASAQLLQSRSLVGLNTDATAQDSLYLQYGNNTSDDVYFGATGGGKIYSNGTQYSGNAATATTATNLGTTTVGGTTTPIYLNAGAPTALSYTIAKSVPSNAVFTDTMVTQTLSSTNAHYPILFSYAGNADTTANVTNICYRNNSVYINPSTGNIRATQLNGVTIGSSPKFTDTTYESKAAASGGTAVSLCTTGEKYTWNNKLSSGGAIIRASMVGSTTSYSADNMRGMTRFLYTTHGVPHSGTTVAFDSSNVENYTLQLNANYSGAAANARLSFRTRNGDTSKWSNWLYACPVYRFNTRLEANSNQTLYVPLEMRNGTAGDSFFLVASNNYGNSGLYFLTPNTAVAHQMVITTIKASSYLTIAAVSDDWGFKVTAGSAAYYLTLIRLS